MWVAAVPFCDHDSEEVYHGSNNILSAWVIPICLWPGCRCWGLAERGTR